MATTTHSAIDLLKSAMNDRGGSFLSDDEYEQHLLSAASPEATYPARRLCLGTWAVPLAPLCLYGASFDEAPGADYTLNCGGTGFCSTVSLRLTAGVDTRDSIDITGCKVDLHSVLAELFTFLADHRALEYSQSFAGGTVSVATAREELLKQAEIHRGVVAV